MKARTKKKRLAIQIRRLEREQGIPRRLARMYPLRILTWPPIRPKSAIHHDARLRILTTEEVIAIGKMVADGFARGTTLELSPEFQTSLDSFHKAVAEADKAIAEAILGYQESVAAVEAAKAKRSTGAPPHAFSAKALGNPTVLPEEAPEASARHENRHEKGSADR